ncbi:MAG: hypothetical protein ACI4Q7_03435 [Candidatus Avelusimicrobium sp.]
MTLNDIFKNIYGKDWKQASFWEKVEAVIFGVVVFQFVSYLFFHHD